MSLEQFNNGEQNSSIRGKINGNFSKLSTVTVTHSTELTFSQNKYMATSLSQSGAISYTLAPSGNVDGVVIRHKILSDGINTITFSADFNVFNKSPDDIYPAGLHVFYFNYVGGEVDVAIPTYSTTSNQPSLDTIAPTIASATIENTSPTNLVVVFSEVVNITDLTGLSISGTGAPTINSVSGTGTNTLTFVLGSGAVYDSSWTFEVTVNNNIEDTASTPNGLAATSETITNNVEPSVNITSPTEGETFTEGNDITISSTIS